MNITQGLVAVIGCVALGAAGYFANEWHACGELEADVVQTASNIRNNASLRSNGAALRLDLPFEELESIGTRDEQLMVQRLTAVYDRCGLDAGEAASQKAQDVLARGL